MEAFDVSIFILVGLLLGVIVVELLANLISRRRRSRRRVTVTKKQGILSRIGTMNLILILIGTSLIWFTHRMVVLYETTGGIPDTLVQCVFAVLGGECGVMGWIKTNKDKRQDRQWAEEDRKRMEQEAKQSCDGPEENHLQ